MSLIYHKIYKIDKDQANAVEENFENQQNIEEYLQQVIEKHRGKYEREYKFIDDELTAKTNVSNIVNNVTRDNACKAMADRLLEKEKAANLKIRHLGISIPQSILIIAVDKMGDNELHLFFIKADYDQYIKSGSGNKEKGLPANRKIFKSCLFISKNNGTSYKFEHIMSHDENSQRSEAVYWYKEFLDLVELTSDEKNTKRAYSTIKTKVLEDIKRKSKQDYFTLRNMIIGYFRRTAEFDIDELADNTIKTYEPFNPALDMHKIAEQIKKLPDKFKFDRKFNLVPERITDKFVDSINLTDDIELKIKQEILGIGNIIKAGIDEGNKKYIKIYSEDGYKYAEGLNR